MFLLPKVCCRFGVRGYGVWVVSLLLFCACAHQPEAVSESEAADFSGVRKLMVFPFGNMAAARENESGVRCPFGGSMFIAGTVEPQAENVLTDGLLTKLRILRKYDAFPAGPAAYPETGRYDIADRQNLTRIARKAGADSIMIGHIFRYRERAGNEYAVSSPASVAFDVHLIRVSDGRLMWSGRCDETQQALTENLFKLGAFLERKGKWVSADELALSGLGQVLKPFEQ